MELLLEDKELHRLYELYQNDCVQHGARGSLSDFMVWAEDNYPEMFVDEPPEYH